MLVASMFSAVIGNAFPGSIYLSQTLKFMAPVPGLPSIPLILTPPPPSLARPCCGVFPAVTACWAAEKSTDA
jgi:hypothetical protein